MGKVMNLKVLIKGCIGNFWIRTIWDLHIWPSSEWCNQMVLTGKEGKGNYGWLQGDVLNSESHFGVTCIGMMVTCRTCKIWWWWWDEMVYFWRKDEMQWVVGILALWLLSTLTWLVQLKTFAFLVDVYLLVDGFSGHHQLSWHKAFWSVSTQVFATRNV